MEIFSNVKCLKVLYVIGIHHYGFCGEDAVLYIKVPIDLGHV